MRLTVIYVIGAFVLKITENLHGDAGRFMDAWGNDIRYSFAAWLLIATIAQLALESPNPLKIFATVYGILSALEFMQLLQIKHIFFLTGTFDFPGDFIAYFIGAGIGLLLDLTWIRND